MRLQWNDATVALAERVGGSEKQFVQMMNARAKQLHLRNTHFSNTNGLPIANHYTSAYDIAMIGRALLKYPEILTFTSIYEDYLRKDTKNPFWLVNSNKLLRFYKGADGLKTGYTSEAGSCLAATAKRGELRLIAVVLGEPSAKVRNAEISDLLDYGFSQFITKKVVKKGSLLGTIRVKDGTPSKLNITAHKTISVLVARNQAASVKYKTSVTWKKSIAAPLKKGTKIGTLHVLQGGKVIKSETLYAPKTVKRSGFFDNLKQVIYSITMSK
jgi:D-alanyl-D-alanine carboxypeptidase (penicillin-binding protein 5/6)